MADYRFILASGSPRRREIMDKIGAQYIIIPSNKDEDMSEPDPETLVKGLARMKAEDVSGTVLARLSSGELDPSYSNCVIIGCDTIVAFGDKRLGKPHSTQEAFNMIRAFSGKTHCVFTGVCLIMIRNSKVEKTVNYAVRTEVDICEMSDEEINAYVATGESMDKAGAYAIQGCFCPFISAIRGDYYNIVGYPVSSIYHSLLAEGIRLF